MTKINKNSIYLFFQEKIIYEGLKVKDFLYAKEGVIELEAKNRNLISIKGTNQIICPICGEAAEFKIENCRVTIVGCKNNHRISNINFNTFEETQLTDFSKIKCKKCGWTFKNDENIKLNYCFIKAQPNKICSNLKFIELYRKSLIDKGNDNQLTQLTALIDFIRNITYSNLNGITQEEFTKKCNEVINAG